MIRPLKRDELAAFEAIRAEALRSDPDAFGETSEHFEALGTEGRREKLGVMLEGPRQILIAEAEGQPIAMCGFGLSNEDASRGFLWGLFVRPEQRGQGLASQLLARAEQWLSEQGATCLEACVAAPNASAIEFYRRCGYDILPPSGTLREGSNIPVHPIRKAL